MTVQDSAMIEVQNLVSSTVTFKDEDTHRRIVFQGHEKKKLDAGLLRRLNYSHGGNVLLREYLSVKNAELAKEFGVSEDTVEYNWEKKNVDEVLTTGSMDQLLDALDFGPEGIKDMIVERATELEINDVEKRKAILDKTGHNIDQKIKNIHDYNKDNDKVENTTPAGRRTAVKPEQTGRRVQQ